MKNRCSWVTEDPIYIDYHDNEWGRPVYDDQHLFEMLSLEGAQAGLSWITILKRRENYRRAFDYFDPSIVAHYDDEKVKSLLNDKGIIRNKLKINSVITNAKAVLTIQQNYPSFAHYLWQFVDGRPMINQWETNEDVPTSTKESTKMSKDLKKHGFKFVGPVICYAFMQAVGMVNDHTKDCFLSQNKSNP